MQIKRKRLKALPFSLKSTALVVRLIFPGVLLVLSAVLVGCHFRYFWVLGGDGDHHRTSTTIAGSILSSSSSVYRGEQQSRHVTTSLGISSIRRRRRRQREDKSGIYDDENHNTIMEDEESLSYLRSFHNINRPLSFFHIPKTAGTAIEFAAGTRKKAWGSCMFSHKPKRQICEYPQGGSWPSHIGFWHIPRSFFPVNSIDPYQGNELFAVARDSYDRMVSEFYYTCTLKDLDWRPNQCDQDKLFDKQYMNEWLQNKLKNGDYDDDDRHSNSPLAYLTDNGHFTPQYEFIVGPNNVRMIDYVLRLGDSLGPQFAKLMNSYELDKVRLQKVNALGAEARDARTHLGVDHLNEETLRWIHNKYPNDFDFGYQRKEIKTS